MTTISIDEIQRNLMSYLEQVKTGETLLILENVELVAEMKPVVHNRTALRPYALCASEFRVPDDFDAPLPNEIVGPLDPHRVLARLCRCRQQESVTIVSMELLDQLRELNRADKLHVIQVLVSELAQEETDLLKPGMAYPIWSPYDAFEAANTMLEVLRTAETGDHA